MKMFFFVIAILLPMVVSEVDIFEEIAQNNKNSVDNSEGLVINLKTNLFVDNKTVGKLDFVRDAKISGLGNKRKLQISVDVVNETSSIINTASSFLAIEHVEFSLSSVCFFPSLIYAMSSSFVNIDTVDFSPKQDERKGKENNGMLSPINAALFAVVDSMLTLCNSVISKFNFTGEGSAALVVTGNAQVVLNNTLFINLGISSLAWSLVSMGDNRASVRSSTLFSRSLSLLPSSPSNMRQRYLDNEFSSGGLIISGCQFSDISMDSSGTMANGVILDIIIESLVNITESVISGITASIGTTSPVDFVLGVMHLVGNLEGAVNIISSSIQSLFVKGNVTEDTFHSFGIILETIKGTFTNVSLTATSTPQISVGGERFLNLLDPLKCSYDAKPGSGEVLKVKLHSGSIMKKPDLLVNGDTYVKLKCAGQEGRSTVELNTLNPVWDQGFELSVKADATAEQKKLVLELWNRVPPDIYVGTGVVEDPMIYRDVVGQQGIKGKNVSVTVELKKNEDKIGMLIIFITIPEAEDVPKAFITHSYNHRGVRLSKKTLACIDREWLLLGVNCAVGIIDSLFNCTQTGGLLLQTCNATLNGSTFGLVYKKVSDVLAFALPYSTFPSFNRFIECLNGSIVDVIVPNIVPNLFFFASADSILTINSNSSIVSSFIPLVTNITSSVLGIVNETKTGTETQANSLLETIVVTLVGERLFPCNLIYQIFHPNGSLAKLPGGELLQSFVTGLTENIVTFNFSAFEGWEEAEVRVAVKDTEGAVSQKIPLSSGISGGRGNHSSGGNDKKQTGVVVGIVLGAIVGVVSVAAVVIVVAVLLSRRANKIQDTRVITREEDGSGESGNDSLNKSWSTTSGNRSGNNTSVSEEPRVGSYVSPTYSSQSQFLPKSGGEPDTSLRSKRKKQNKGNRDGGSINTSNTSNSSRNSTARKKRNKQGNEGAGKRGSVSSNRNSKKSRVSSSEVK